MKDTIQVNPNIKSNLEYPFNDNYTVTKSKPPYTNTGFTKSGIPEYVAQSPEIDIDGKPAYFGEVYPTGTIRVVYDKNGNEITSFKWEINEDVKPMTGNWYGKDADGKYLIPQIENGGINVEKFGYKSEK